MAVVRATTWVANDILTAAALNAEFNLLIGASGQAVSFPRTLAADFDGQTLILDAAGTTTLSAAVADEIDIDIAGVDSIDLSATNFSIAFGGVAMLALSTTELTLLGKRVLTTDDASRMRVSMASVVRVGTLEARVAGMESEAVMMTQLNNF